ncbi:Craniofacial development protein 2 [Frankliniella fusca]|uniref:Craniofacial development protein 2 n=1 Tax=Frankliniella fusca TaxID=407009 RepID=A0AAE1LTH0_9NEOP|nr:Craniofacial development protein 2 [Frankliniella fusca]
MEADGNCLFYAVSHQLKIIAGEAVEAGSAMHKELAARLRWKAALHIQAFPHRFEAAVVADAARDKQGYAAFVDPQTGVMQTTADREGATARFVGKLKEDNTWAGEEALVAIAEAHQTRILVYFEAQDPLSPESAPPRLSITPEFLFPGPAIKIMYRISKTGNGERVHYDSVYRIREHRRQETGPDVLQVRPSPVRPSGGKNTTDKNWQDRKAYKERKKGALHKQVTLTETGQEGPHVPKSTVSHKQGMLHETSEAKPNAPEVTQVPTHGRCKPRAIPKKKPMRIATWNVRTMYKAGAATNVAAELSRLGIAVAGLQEVRWAGLGQLRMGDYIIYWSGPTEGSRREHGVGIAVHKHIVKAVRAFIPAGKRVAAVLMRAQENNIAFISCHAPCESDRNMEEKERFYTALTTLVSSDLPKGNVKVILGDMNAQLGPPLDTKDKRRSKFTFHKKDNGNGRSLMAFASAMSMTVASTRSPRPRKERYTWSSANGKDRSQIDHILIDSRCANWIQGTRSEWSACNDSDHALVMATMTVRPNEFSGQDMSHLSKSPKKLRLDRLQDSEVLQEFQVKVARKLGFEVQDGGSQDGQAELTEVSQTEPTGETGINEIWERIRVTLTECGKEILGEEQRTKGKHWYDAECEEAAEQRNSMWRWHREDPTDSHIREGYEEVDKMYRKTLRRAKRRYLNNQCQEMEEAREAGSARKFYTKVRRQKQGYVPQTNMVRNPAGQLVVSADSIVEAWRTHFTGVLGQKQVADKGQELQTNTEAPAQKADVREEDPPTTLEVKSALQSMKKGKAPGADGLAAELLLMGGEGLTLCLTALLVKVWEEESIPEAWEEALITVLHKGKGAAHECDNFRGLSLLNTGYKLCSTVLLRRLQPYADADAAIGEYQAGFRRNRSTTDHVYAVRALLAKRREFQQDTHLIFVDFAKAYDSVKREELWSRLYNLDVPAKLIRLIKSLSRSTRNKVRALGFLSEDFETAEGVRQGDALSPLLFNLALESALRRFFERASPRVQLLAYADDIAILTDSQTLLAEAMELLEMECAARQGATTRGDWSAGPIRSGVRIVRNRIESNQGRFDSNPS